MKTLLFALIFLSVFELSAAEQGTIDLGALTHEEFTSLYKADQIQYIKLLQEAAVELSFQADYLAFRTTTTPSFFSLFAVEAETDAAKVDKNYFENGLEVASNDPNEITESRSPANDPARGLKIVLVNPNTAPAPVSGTRLAVLPPSVAGVSSTGTTGAPESGMCVRCVYGGFAIVNDKKCHSVSSLDDEKQSLHNLKLPDEVTNKNLSCSKPTEPVLCNPILFGLKDNGPLCVSKSSGATRSCSGVSGKDDASYAVITKIILANKPAYTEQLKQWHQVCNLKNNCADVKSSGAIADIRSTCASLKEKFLSYREAMRVIAGGGAGGVSGTQTSTSTTTVVPPPAGVVK